MALRAAVRSARQLSHLHARRPRPELSWGSTQLIKNRREQGRSLVLKDFVGVLLDKASCVVRDAASVMAHSHVEAAALLRGRQRQCRTRTRSRPARSLDSPPAAERDALYVDHASESSYALDQSDSSVPAKPSFTCRSRLGTELSPCCLSLSARGRGRKGRGKRGRGEEGGTTVHRPLLQGLYYAAGGRFEAGGGVPARRVL